jgi:hypothetical protein
MGHFCLRLDCERLTRGDLQKAETNLDPHLQPVDFRSIELSLLKTNELPDRLGFAQSLSRLSRAVSIGDASAWYRSRCRRGGQKWHIDGALIACARQIDAIS